MMNKHYDIRVIYYFFIPVIFFLVHKNIIFGSYIFHDMWDYFGYKFLQSKSCFDFENYPLFKWFALALGRFFGYLVLCFQVEIISSPENAYLSRLITFFGIIVFYFLNGYVVNIVSQNRDFSYIFSFAIISLPGFLFTISWIGTGFIIFSWIFSLISFLFFLKFLSSQSLKKYIYLSFFSLFSLFGFLFYQMGPLYIFLILLIYIIFNFKKSILDTQIIKLYLINFLQIFILFLIFKFFFLEFLAEMDFSRGSLLKNLSKNIQWFLAKASPRALDLFLIRPSYGWGVLNICVAITFFYSIRKIVISYKALKDRISILFLIMGSFVILNAPLILSSYGVETYRVLTNFSSLVICIFLLMIFKLERYKKNYSIFSKILVLFIIFTNVYNSFFLNEKIVIPRVNEIAFYKAEVKKIISSNLYKIHFDNSMFLTPEKSIWRTDEIGIANSAFFYHVPDIINYYIEKNGVDHKKFEIRRVEDFKNTPKDVYKLDLNVLVNKANINIE